jgi:hypothetical protein
MHRGTFCQIFQLIPKVVKLGLMLRSNYHHPFSEQQYPSKPFSWPFSIVQEVSEPKCPSWLEWLRRLAEISKLTTEMAQNRVVQFALNPLKTPVANIMTQALRFKHEDLDIRPLNATNA